MQAQHRLWQLPSLHENTCHAEFSHLQLVHMFHVLSPSSIFFLSPWKEKCMSKDAAWAWMWNREKPFCSKQNFKFPWCVLLSLLCCLIEEIIKLEIREKNRKKAYHDLSLSSSHPPIPASIALGVTKLYFSFLMRYWLQQNYFVVHTACCLY